MKDFDSKTELDKLNEIFRNIPQDKIDLVQGLMADAAFMVEQLSILRKHIDANGWSEDYMNGPNQHCKKASIEADYYVRLQKLYASTIKQLSDFLPDNKSDMMSKAGESIAAAIAKGKSFEVR